MTAISEQGLLLRFWIGSLRCLLLLWSVELLWYLFHDTQLKTALRTKTKDVIAANHRR